MTKADLSLLKAGKTPVSDEVIEYLTLSNIWLNSIKDYCLNQVIANGGCKVKILHGDHFTGKTHYLNYIRIFAQKDNFFSVMFDVSQMDFQITNIASLYKSIASDFDFEKLKESLLLMMLIQLGYDLDIYNLQEGSLCDLICELESAPVYQAKQSIRKCINMLTKDLDISFSFRLFIMKLMEAVAENDKIMLELLRRWVIGDKLQAFEKRQCQLFETLNKQNARIWLYSLSEIIKMCGYKGLILGFDHFESILPQFDAMVKYTASKRNDVYEMLRQLIDDLDFLKNFMLIIAGNTEIILDEKYGLQSYHALWMRIQQSYKQDCMINPYADLIDAGLIMKQLVANNAMLDLANRIDQLFHSENEVVVDEDIYDNDLLKDFYSTLLRQTKKYQIESSHE